MSDTEYDPSGNSSSSLHVGRDIKLIVIVSAFYVFSCIVNTKI